MHELGLVNYVVKEVDKIAKEQGVDKIKSVTLEFGEVSGIVTASNRPRSTTMRKRILKSRRRSKPKANTDPSDTT